jgi:hypothetical protein
MNRYLLFAIALLLANTGCGKSKTKTESASSQSDQTKIVACSLITNDEVQKIQGSAVKDTKPSESADTSFRFSQCFYSTEIFNKSVSLAVTQRNPDSASGRDPKTFWKETFGRYEGQLKEQEGDEEKKKSLTEQDEEKGTPPKKIEGIGDDAWWTANRMGGALYVLKNNVFIRVSIGGPETQESMIEKTKALAAKALSRL